MNSMKGLSTHCGDARTSSPRQKTKSLAAGHFPFLSQAHRVRIRLPAEPQASRQRAGGYRHPVFYSREASRTPIAFRLVLEGAVEYPSLTSSEHLPLPRRRNSGKRTHAWAAALGFALKFRRVPSSFCAGP